MDVAAFDGEASLAGVDERSPDGGARGNVNIGVIEHEHGIFPAEFEHDRQQALGCGSSDAFAGGDAAGEYEFADWRLEQRGAGRAVAYDHLNNIWRNSGGVQK